MSWIFGIIKSNPQVDLPINFSNVHDEPIYKLSTANFYLVFGGIKETCLFEIQDSTQDKGWAVVGLGINLNEPHAQILTKKDWRNLLSSDQIKTENLDGHFLVLRWNNDTIEFFTDQLGLRTAYFADSEFGKCFSTRLDWLTKTVKLSEIELSFLGSRWYLFNQLNFESPINEIKRLKPSSHLIIKSNSILKNHDKIFLPEFGDENGEESKAVLECFVNPSLSGKQVISLGLSGGIDSRTILALLMEAPENDFVVHTFGEADDPDVLISNNISNDFNLHRYYFNDPIPDVDTLIKLSKSFAAQNLLVEPISSILRLRYYSSQYKKNQLIIDGGFGEIARRQYLNRVVKFGKTALLNNNLEKIFQLLQVKRANIFNSDYEKDLKSAAKQSLEKILAEMPSLNNIGIENFADLFSIRTRVPNFGGPEQSRTDAYIINYMPMVQPSFLRAVFKSKIYNRNNGKLFREIIDERYPALKQFPLVKSGTTYPFVFSTSSAWVFTKIKTRIKKPYIDSVPDQLLMQLRNYVLDLVHSNEVKYWPGYDYKKVLHFVEAYYMGDKNLCSAVNWWLTFELWRRSLMT